ncbi:VTT domain-containing protein [Nitrosococcus watsonii]|uniref:Phospholipase D n=1 Tax=Nitrosococcus watsoni (strain C-113) TaxID=105559 RepID=D8K6Q6_NITWC|nr:VTT domain-containing protein [Nitrosococcus watsonii]ADJ28583.1 Phospholipase D [Nitrosococcus watsonii C-113]
MMSFFKPGNNCWRLEQATRAAFLIDGAAYFKAFRSAVEQAEHSILILGWDINSRLRLVRDEPSDSLPETLADLLNTVVSRRRKLQAHVLCWDFAMIYALEREWLPIYQLDWRTHHRLHFEMDDQHPVGASHHQKVVVIDDTVAFAGGLDLSKWRWDTPEHRPNDERRIDSDGNPYPPFHDVQMVVEGPAAAALGDLARERWYRATGQRLSLPPPTSPNQGTTPWPRKVVPNLENISIAIARTEPKFKNYPEIREVERFYLDAIAAAQRFIYIENQYFSAHKIKKALATRLQEPQGPEIILILPLKTGGWLEQNTMDILRWRVLKALVSIDKYDRLRVYCPVAPGLNNQCIMVHAKVLIIDDELARVGSSNLSNRSLGLDTECDLALEAGDNPSVAASIAEFRNRLLGEHLNVSPRQVAQAIVQQESLIAAIEQLRGPGRTLNTFKAYTPPEGHDWLPDARFIDPECSIDPDQFASQIIPPEQRQPASRQLIFSSLMLIIPLALAAAWRWTPLGEWLDLQTAISIIKGLKESPEAPLLVLGVYLLASLIAIPLTLLIVATVIIFGSLTGFTYALISATLSALLTYGLGRLFGRRTVRQLAGKRLNRLSRRLAQQGTLTMLAVRLIPIAPFTVVNMVAGASHIRFRDFTIGTLLGLIPGTLAIAIFIDRVVTTMRNPTPLSFAILGVVLMLLGLSVLGIRWWLRKQEATNNNKTLHTS